jgi:3-methyladenine DNA glycosylase AlkD
MAPTLLMGLRRELSRVAHRKRAPAMQAYMKSEMTFLGVGAVAMRAACRKAFAGVEFKSAAQWRDAVLSIWRGARYREERYGAVELSGIRSALAFQTVAALPMYEEMIVTGAWWDFVDWIASHRLGLLLRRYPAPMRRKMLAWCRSKNLWKRRSAILCQLRFKKETDLKLLYACIEPSLSSPEFFLRKAIGWALRQYAWTDPKEVCRYVRSHEKELSRLSRREALKNVGMGQASRR